jgi:hypothetical protein
MADLERIAPLVPTLPTPVGRNVGSQRRRPPEREPHPRPAPGSAPESSSHRKPESDHIDEYV